MNTRLFLYLLLPLFLCACFRRDPEAEALWVNLDHLDHLYDEKLMPTGENIGYVFPNCRAPAYLPAGEPGVGIASVEDASKAAVAYLFHYRKTDREESLMRARRLLSFLLYMQADNGYFYNYLNEEGLINDTTFTSVAQSGLCSWVALWAMGEALDNLPPGDSLNDPLLRACTHVVNAALAERPRVKDVMNFGGLPLPTWLPHENDANEASWLLLGLCHFQRRSPAPAVREYIIQLAEGILLMQVRNSGLYPSGAFLSFQNVWRSRGNLQAYALLVASEVLPRPAWMQYPVAQIEEYYPRLREQGYVTAWTFHRNTTDTVDVLDQQPFPQSNDGFRPIVWACLKAYRMTGSVQYLDEAHAAGNWFAGDNPAGATMYHPRSGRGYEGIISPTEVNQNAGADATLEALLAIMALSDPAVLE